MGILTGVLTTAEVMLHGCNKDGKEFLQVSLWLSSGPDNYFSTVAICCFRNGMVMFFHLIFKCK